MLICFIIILLNDRKRYNRVGIFFVRVIPSSWNSRLRDAWKPYILQMCKNTQSPTIHTHTDTVLPIHGYVWRKCARTQIHRHLVVQPDFRLRENGTNNGFHAWMCARRIHTHSCCMLLSIVWFTLSAQLIRSVVNSRSSSSNSTWESHDYGEITCKSILGKEICCLMATINCSRILLEIVFVCCCTLYSVHCAAHGIVSQSAQEIPIAASVYALHSHRSWMKGRRNVLWNSRTIRCVQQIQSNRKHR